VTDPLIAAILVLGGIFGLLLGVILVGRWRADRHRRRTARLRPTIETDLALYLADPDADAPQPPEPEEGRRLFRDVAVEALVELTGRERERLAELLERDGIVHETSLELLARRRLTRLHAAEFLAEMRSRSAADTLLIGLLDEDPDVRLACARALAELGEEEFVEPLIAASDEEATERPGAAAAVLLAVGWTSGARQPCGGSPRPSSPSCGWPSSRRSSARRSRAPTTSWSPGPRGGWARSAT
jgi:hypothetical protein